MTSRNNHSPRDTSTGKVNEAEIESFLKENVNQSVYEQAVIDENTLGTGKQHVVDILLGGSAYKKTENAKRWTSEHKGGTLISLKYQKVKGTAEEKITHELDKLQDAIDKHGYKKGIVVLCGDDGWTLKKYFLSDKYKTKMKLIAPNVSITDEENFRKEVV
jgi:hypothetical protein|tara:strand:+ start:95 stop:577 length:483 start_codon:yes stop_codon:yes gene_type:complete